MREDMARAREGRHGKKDMSSFAGKRKRNGSYTVEAALILPVFLVAVLTIGFLIKVIGGAECGMHAAADEARLAAANAYVLNAPIGLSSSIEGRIKEEAPYVTDADVKDLRALSTDGEITVTMKYHLDVPLPLGIYDGFDIHDRLKTRAWIGRTGGDPFGFDAMEEYEDAETVYIFPAWGEKYHTKGCTYVQADPVQMSLTKDVKNRYHSCPRCGSADLSEGALVYVFPSYGEAYHRPGCDSIKKFTVAMEKEQAEHRGYTPCSKCGGG